MLESKVDKAVESADDKTGEDPHQNATSPASKHLTMANNVEVPAKKYQKENFNDGMKTHNFTECCRMWMCTHCSKSFASSRALKIHEVKQHENAARHVLKCGTCHEEFEHSNLLHIHMRVHHNMKVRCPRCKDIFEHPNVLKLHIKAHHSEPVCVACGVRFDHDKLLRLHMEHYHKVSSKGTAKRDLALLNQSMVSDLKKCETPELKVKVESGINTLLEGQVRSMDVGDSHMTTEEMESRRQNELHSKEPNGLASDEGDMIHSQQDSEDEALSEGSSDLGMEGSPEVEGGSPIIEGGSPRVKGESPTVEGESPGADGGGPRVGRGSPRLEGGSPRLEGRSPIVEGGSPGVEGGSPGAIEGSPGAIEGSPRLKGGSPRLERGSPRLKGGSPELKGGSPWVEGRSPRVEGGNPGGDKGSCLEFDDKSSVGCGVVDSHEGQHGPEGSRHFLLSLLKSGNQRNIEENKVTVSEVKGETEVTTEEMDIEPVTRSFDYCRELAQLQRSSVIVTTGSISSTGFIPQANLNDKVDDVEEPSLRLAERRDNFSDIDNSPKGSPQSHADSMSSTLSGDESADSEHANQRARTTKRATLRCNRCPVEFYSKMEYLHHLISHQDGEDSRNSSEQSSQGQTIVRLGRHFFTKKLESSKTEETADELNVEEHRIPVEKNSSTPELDRDPNIAGTFHEAVRRDLPNAEERSRGFSIVCSMCKELFTDSRAHKLHVEKCHKKPHCGECGLAFDHKNLLKIHMNSYHSSKEVLQCYYCDESFAYRSEFLSHVTSHETKPSSSEETVRKPNNLRRTRSAIETEETEGQILPKRLRSSSLANTNRFERRQSDASANINRFEWRPSDSSALALVEGFALRQSPVDNARPCVGERSRGSDALGLPEKRDGHTQRKQEWDKEGESGFSDGRGTKTRIFLPKPQDDAKHHSAWAVLSPRDKLNHESVEQASRRLSQDYRLSAFTRYERSGHSNDFAKNLMRGYSSHMRHNSEQTEKPLGRPPPLIPVVHPRAAHTMTRQADIPLKKDGLFLRAHQPVTRTCSDNSALRPYKSPFPSRKLLEVPSPSRSATREGAQECQTFTAHESINNVTKEALLNSLSLRRRASAPELGALVRQFGDIQGGSGRSPTLQAPRRSENPKSPLASPVVHLTGRARQLNEAYQPRRRHPRDFTCHHCGIYFGHKKLLKIHLDCYHGSAQELQCLPCGKNFSDRSDFLEHLMSHEGDEKMLAKPAKAPRLSEPKGERLVHEGETIIRRELNRTSVMDNTVTREAPHSREPVGSTRGTFSKETSVVGRHRPRSVMHKRETESTTEARGAVVAPQSGARTEEDDGANFCFVCGKSFNSGKQLEQHISSHAVVDKDGRYCCSLCHKTFDHHRKLEIHSRSHTGFKPHKCELCGRCFPYYSSYYYHKMTHTEDRPHKCTVCGKGFIQTRYLRSHMKTHKEQSEWNSDEDLKEEIPAQLKENDNQQMQESQMSGFGTKVKTEPVDESDCLPQGELEEQTTARILCSFKQVNNIGLSETHPRVDVKPASIDLKKSVNTELVRDVIPEETSCVGISSGPTREQASDCHQNPGSSQESVNDQVAPVETLSRVKTEQLLNGESTRNSAEPAGVPKLKKKTYQCKHCHKNFSSYSSLHVHVRIHTGQRPYSCNHCFKRFTHSSGLKRHVRCHTGEKPYPCPACPAAFADRGALKSHIRTHTGERPFICDLCKKTFTQPSSLRVHKKTVHAHEFFDDK